MVFHDLHCRLFIRDNLVFLSTTAGADRARFDFVAGLAVKLCGLSVKVIQVPGESPSLPHRQFTYYRDSYPDVNRLQTEVNGCT